MYVCLCQVGEWYVRAKLRVKGTESPDAGDATASVNDPAGGEEFYLLTRMECHSVYNQIVSLTELLKLKSDDATSSSIAESNAGPLKETGMLQSMLWHLVTTTSHVCTNFRYFRHSN